MNVKDRISGLPDFILHHILSFLPRKDAFRMSGLSKRWKLVLDTYPNLDFDWRDFGEEIIITEMQPEDLTEVSSPEFWETLEKLINCVDQSLSRFSEHNFSLKRFKLLISLPDMKLASSLDEWVRVAIENGVKEVDLLVDTPGYFLYRDVYTLPKTIFAAASLTILKLCGCYVGLEELCCVKLYSLKKLLLGDVYIHDHAVGKLVACCPLIEEISLHECWGLENVQICGLYRLKKVEISSCMHGPNSIEIISPSLESCFFSFSHRAPTVKPTVKVDACQGLKSLMIYGSIIAEQFFQHLDSKFPILESLTVSNCLTLTMVKISSCSLKHLCIISCNNIVDIEIDTPTLLTCNYYGFTVPFSLINAPSCEWQVDFYLKDTINILWYTKLKEFLAKLNQLMYLHICFSGTEFSLNLEDWNNNTSPSTMDDLVLTVHPAALVSNYTAFMDGLFWFFRPKNLFVRSGNGQNRYVEYLSDCTKRDPSCCSHKNVKCWRHDLKEVKVESFEEHAENMPPYDKSILFPFPPERSHTHCKMEWQF